jgi:hypothetical protein
MTPKSPAAKGAAKQARKKPCRKGGAAKPKKRRSAQPKTSRSKLVWRGVTIAVTYKPGGIAGYGHLELRVLAPEDVPIPVTETGYRSHFLFAQQVKAAGGPVAYVRRWLEQEARSPAYRRALERWRQLELF